GEESSDKNEIEFGVQENSTTLTDPETSDDENYSDVEEGEETTEFENESASFRQNITERYQNFHLRCFAHSL
ncbi:hypothetical protein BpHYR1_023643, partial [Brachionus plicatilis]